MNFKFHFLLLLIILLFSNFIEAQDEKERKFSFAVETGLGMSKLLYSTQDQDYKDLAANFRETYKPAFSYDVGFLSAYHLNKKSAIQMGVKYMSLRQTTGKTDLVFGIIGIPLDGTFKYKLDFNSSFIDIPIRYIHDIKNWGIVGGISPNIFIQTISKTTFYSNDEKSSEKMKESFNGEIQRRANLMGEVGIRYLIPFGARYNLYVMPAFKIQLLPTARDQNINSRFYFYGIKIGTSF